MMGYISKKEATIKSPIVFGTWVPESDYEQLQQAHSKAVELAAQLAKQVGGLTGELTFKSDSTESYYAQKFIDECQTMDSGWPYDDCMKLLRNLKAKVES